MPRQHLTAALAGAVIALALAGLYPLTIDENLVCGGITARVAITGPARSSGGELTPDVIRQIEHDRHRCQTKARRILLGATPIGAAIGYAGALLLTRRHPGRPST